MNAWKYSERIAEASNDGGVKEKRRKTKANGMIIDLNARERERKISAPR